jgi:hypothetical protein
VYHTDFALSRAGELDKRITHLIQCQPEMPNVGQLIRSTSTEKVPVYEVALDAVQNHAFASLASVARAIGANYWTVYEYWRGPRAKPEFQEAFRVSRQWRVDEIKEKLFERAGSDNPTDLSIIYTINNFDEEVVERNVKNRDATITIKLDVPTKPETIEGWSREVAALPPADYREIAPS